MIAYDKVIGVKFCNTYPIRQSLELQTKTILKSTNRNLDLYNPNEKSIISFPIIRYFHFNIWIIDKYSADIFTPICNYTLLLKSKSTFRFPVSFISSVDYGNVSIMGFHRHEHYSHIIMYSLLYHVFTSVLVRLH